MQRVSIFAAAWLAVLGAQTTATAQQSETSIQTQDGSSMSIITTAPRQNPSREAWLQQDLAEAKARVRRTRNALIGTSAAFALGAVFSGVGASQCQVISVPNQNDELLCNNAGDVLLPLGVTISGLSVIGMLTSGIMLGVANKRKREIERDIRQIHYGRRLRWESPSGAWLF